MTTHAKITQFLSDAKRTDNLATTREMYARALELLREVAEMFTPPPGWDGIDDVMPIEDIFVKEAQFRNWLIDAGWTPPKPEDKL